MLCVQFGLNTKRFHFFRYEIGISSSYEGVHEQINSSNTWSVEQEHG